MRNILVSITMIFLILGAMPLVISDTYRSVGGGATSSCICTDGEGDVIDEVVGDKGDRGYIGSASSCFDHCDNYRAKNGISSVPGSRDTFVNKTCLNIGSNDDLDPSDRVSIPNLDDTLEVNKDNALMGNSSKNPVSMEAIGARITDIDGNRTTIESNASRVDLSPGELARVGGSEKRLIKYMGPSEEGQSKSNSDYRESVKFKILNHQCDGKVVKLGAGDEFPVLQSDHLTGKNYTVNYTIGRGHLPSDLSPKTLRNIDPDNLPLESISIEELDRKLKTGSTLGGATIMEINHMGGELKVYICLCQDNVRDESRFSDFERNFDASSQLNKEVGSLPKVSKEQPSPQSKNLFGRIGNLISTTGRSISKLF